MKFDNPTTGSNFNITIIPPLDAASGDYEVDIRFYLSTQFAGETIESRVGWVVVGSLSLGGGVWATHLIGMLAFMGAGRYGAKLKRSIISSMLSGRSGTIPVASNVSSIGASYKSANFE